MQGDRRVEVGLGQPRLHGDGGGLQNFGRVGADHMKADDLIGRRIDDHLVQRPFVAAGEDIFHRPEIAGVDAHCAQLVACLCLGHPDRADRGMAEHRARDIGIVDGRRLAAENAVGERLPLADRHRRQLDTIGHIADGIDARHRRLIIVIDLDRTILVEFDTRRFQTQPLGVRYPSGRDEHRIGGDRIAIFEMDHQRSVILFLDRLERRVEAEFDPLGHRNLEQTVADLLVIAAQYRVAAVDDRHLAAEFVEDARKFIGDIAAASNHHALRQTVEVKHLVRRDRMFAARKFGDEGPAAGRHQDAFGGEFGPVGEPYLLRTDDGRARLEDRNLVIIERLTVETFETRHFAQHIVAQPLPVEMAIGNVPAEMPRVLQIFCKVRPIDEQLLGHAAANDAGAADPMLLGDRNARAV